MGHVAFPFNMKQFLFHRGCSFKLKSILEVGLVARGKKPKRKRNCVLHSLDPWSEEIEEKYQGDLSKFIRRLSGNALKTPSIGFMWPRHRKRNILANKFACHHCLHDSAAWLYRKSDISERWDDLKSTTLYTKASFKNNSQKCLEWAAAR